MKKEAMGSNYTIVLSDRNLCNLYSHLKDSNLNTKNIITPKT